MKAAQEKIAKLEKERFSFKLDIETLRKRLHRSEGALRKSNTLLSIANSRVEELMVENEKLREGSVPMATDTKLTKLTKLHEASFASQIDKYFASNSGPTYFPESPVSESSYSAESLAPGTPSLSNLSLSSFGAMHGRGVASGGIGPGSGIRELAGEERGEGFSGVGIPARPQPRLKTMKRNFGVIPLAAANKDAVAPPPQAPKMGFRKCLAAIEARRCFRDEGFSDVEIPARPVASRLRLKTLRKNLTTNEDAVAPPPPRAPPPRAPPPQAPKMGFRKCLAAIEARKCLRKENPPPPPAMLLRPAGGRFAKAAAAATAKATRR